MGDALSFADVAEGVRAALAVYTHALDDGRVDDVVATFCSDGTITIPGLGTHTGTEQLHAAYSGWTPRRPQRHLVLNTAVSDWSDEGASAVSDVVVLIHGKEGWKTQIVGRYHDTLHREGDAWRFHTREAKFVETE